MNLPIRFRDEAAADLIETMAWYAKKQPGLDQRFLEALNLLVRRVQVAPTSFAPSYKQVRRAPLKRFPYVLYYRIQDDWIDVIAILHGRRSPRVWRDRS